MHIKTLEARLSEMSCSRKESRGLIVSVMFLMLLLSFSTTLFASKLSEQPRKMALVIGNDRYQGLENLPNVRNDTKLISKKLAAVGFDIKVLRNTSRREMLQGIRKFGAELRFGDVAFFYYAGHAVQHRNSNYLVPSTQAGELDESTLEFDAIDVDRVFAQMRDSGSAVNIVVLDACRNNPFKTTRSIGGTQGLANPSYNVKGMYVAFATSPGDVAADGASVNSPYTKALAKYIDKPGLSINDVFINVRRDVIEETNNRQVPWVLSSLTDKFYFAGQQTSKEIEIEKELLAEIEVMKIEIARLKKEKKAEVKHAKSLVRKMKIEKSKRNEKQRTILAPVQKQLSLEKAKRKQVITVKNYTNKETLTNRYAKQRKFVFTNAEPTRPVKGETERDQSKLQTYQQPKNEKHAKLDSKKSLAGRREDKTWLKARDKSARVKHKNRLKRLLRMKQREDYVNEEKILIGEMVKGCKKLSLNSSAGIRVYKCYSDVLLLDEDNAQAMSGLKQLRVDSKQKLAHSLEDNKYGAANRAYQVLAAFDPVKTRSEFYKQLERLRSSIYDDTRKRTIPNF